jgi:hypothetical protein
LEHQRFSSLRLTNELLIPISWKLF